MKKICACIGQPFLRPSLPIKSTIASYRASFTEGSMRARARALKIQVLICSAPPTLRTSGCSRRRRLSASLSGFYPDNRRCKRDLGGDNAETVVVVAPSEAVPRGFRGAYMYIHIYTHVNFCSNFPLQRPVHATARTRIHACRNVGCSRTVSTHARSHTTERVNADYVITIPAHSREE